jgi:hypothetical protein
MSDAIERLEGFLLDVNYVFEIDGVVAYLDQPVLREVDP